MHDEFCLVLDDAKAGCGMVFRSPSSLISADEPDDVAPALQAMQSALDRGAHLAGYLGYELGYVLEPRLAALLPKARKVPLLKFGVFEHPPVRMESDAFEAACPEGRVYTSPLAFEWDRSTYRTRFDVAKEAIAAGDIYQVNLSMRGSFKLTGSPRLLYQLLRKQSNAAHSAFLADGQRHVLSLSPELFFKIDADRRIVARPMKGTAPRGTDDRGDARLRDRLAVSEKDRAENLMIVDLIRNDLGRIAQVGTVEVSDLFAVETYPTVHQMVSTVSARIIGPPSVDRVLRSLFPCGSITGAPKIRAMEIIRALEDGPRGIYCGSIGTFSPDGSAQFSVAIRTITIVSGEGELGVGGAVVSDSSADAEYDECLLKARYLEAARRPIGLIETFRGDVSGFLRLENHLGRMAASARELGIPFDLAAAHRALRPVHPRPRAKPCRIRLHLDETGSFTATAGPIGAEPDVWRYRVSGTRLRSDDRLLRHKTDWREVYEREYRIAEEAGFDEVIFLNERDEVCEGSRSNVFAVVRGRLTTPPVSSGVLDGCLRRELIEKGECAEAVLTLADLESARIVYFGNSLRGLIRGVGRPRTESPMPEDVLVSNGEVE